MQISNLATNNSHMFFKNAQGKKLQDPKVANVTSLMKLETDAPPNEFTTPFSPHTTNF